ncbi:FG-GAP repeat domain-containing protein [Sorangium sp. So ce1078]|uniref:FG-GAP repeat domain-containing protein n=1 Tax=Sorangium sp. So ce1078 TaxID=3133329 RepID=UPI003F61F1CE
MPDVAVAHGGEHGHGRVRLVPSTSHDLGSNFYPAGEGPVAMAAGDLDRDGHPDLVVANDPHTPGESAVHVLLNHGDGTFAGVTSYGDSSRASGIIVTECTGDDAPDVVLMDRHLTVMVNQGDGTFDRNRTYPVASTYPPLAVAVADLDGDGRADFATVDNLDAVELKLSQSDSLSSRNLAGTGTSIVATDVDGDGHPDLAIGLKNLSPAHDPVTEGAVNVLRNQGDGTFEDAVLYPLGSAVRAIVSADFDADGHPDLTALGRDVRLFRNQGDGTFDVSTIVSLGQLSAYGGTAAADLDGDGHLDLAIPGSVEGASGGLLVLRGHGDGTFAAAEDYGIGGIGGLIAEDFDADGRPHLAFLDWNVYAWGARVLINTCLP